MLPGGEWQPRRDVLVQVLELSDNIRKQIPENIDYEQTIKIMISDTSPLKTVLLQEV